MTFSLEFPPLQHRKTRTHRHICPPHALLFLPSPRKPDKWPLKLNHGLHVSTHHFHSKYVMWHRGKSESLFPHLPFPHLHRLPISFFHLFTHRWRSSSSCHDHFIFRGERWNGSRWGISKCSMPMTGGIVPLNFIPIIPMPVTSLLPTFLPFYAPILLLYISLVMAPTTEKMTTAGIKPVFTSNATSL